MMGIVKFTAGRHMDDDNMRNIYLYTVQERKKEKYLAIRSISPNILQINVLSQNFTRCI